MSNLLGSLTSAATSMTSYEKAIEVVQNDTVNVNTPGYTRKTLDQDALSSGGLAIGVRLKGVNRELETFLQTQLRTESSGASPDRTRRVRPGVDGCKWNESLVRTPSTPRRSRIWI